MAADPRGKDVIVMAQTDLDDADLKSNVDFRTVYSEFLTKVVRTDPQPILGTTAAPLGFLV